MTVLRFNKRRLVRMVESANYFNRNHEQAKLLAHVTGFDFYHFVLRWFSK